MSDPPPDVLAARFITVSATYGAGGSVVAPLLARRVGLPFADRLIEARNAPAAPSEEGVTKAELEEEPRRSFFARLAQVNVGLNLPAPRDPDDLRDHVRDRVAASIKALAAEGGAVILGRAGQVVLAYHPRTFHVRLDGPPERRAARGAMWEGIDLETAHARMKETDEARARYTRRLYQRDPADPSLYHLVVDPTVLDLEVGVDMLARAAESFWARDESAVQHTIEQTRELLARLHIDTKP
jgi:cytidylate kinase